MIDPWIFDGVNKERVHLALEFELGGRVAAASHFENWVPNDGIPWRETHIEELCKEAKRRVDFEKKVRTRQEFIAREGK